MAPTLQSDTRQAKSRRISKHITERKRRARINDSLLQLKTIVYPAVKNEVVQNSKMEKADILDMTLRYVKDIQQKTREGKEPNIDQYHAGYSECLSQVSQFLTSCDSMCLETRRRLLTHLADKGLTVECSKPSQENPLLPAASPVDVKVSPETQAPSAQPLPPPTGIVYLLPAQSLQPVVQSTMVPQSQLSPTHTVFSTPTVSLLPTPPHSPIAVQQQSPTAENCYQTVIGGAHQVHQSTVSMVPVAIPVSSAKSEVWRPW